MAKHGDGAVGDHRQRLHVGSESVDLGAVYLTMGERARPGFTPTASARRLRMAWNLFVDLGSATNS